MAKNLTEEAKRKVLNRTETLDDYIREVIRLMSKKARKDAEKAGRKFTGVCFTGVTKEIKGV